MGNTRAPGYASKFLTTDACRRSVNRFRAITEAIRLVSGGETSYPGIVEYDGKLYVSY